MPTNITSAGVRTSRNSVFEGDLATKPAASWADRYSSTLVRFCGGTEAASKAQATVEVMAITVAQRTTNFMFVSRFLAATSAVRLLNCVRHRKECDGDRSAGSPYRPGYNHRRILRHIMTECGQTHPTPFAGTAAPRRRPAAPCVAKGRRQWCCRMG